MKGTTIHAFLGSFYQQSAKYSFQGPCRLISHITTAKSCSNNKHKSLDEILTEPWIEPANSCSQVLYAIDLGTWNLKDHQNKKITNYKLIHLIRWLQGLVHG